MMLLQYPAVRFVVPPEQELISDFSVEYWEKKQVTTSVVPKKQKSIEGHEELTESRKRPHFKVFFDDRLARPNEPAPVLVDKTIALAPKLFERIWKGNTQSSFGVVNFFWPYRRVESDIRRKCRNMLAPIHELESNLHRRAYGGR
jgi:hypothetical protein